MSNNIPGLKKAKFLCMYVGGSHLYGLNTPSSDIDERYVFMNVDIGDVIGLDRFDYVDKRENGEDIFGVELRGFLNLLRKTNTQVLEVLYADRSAFSILDPVFASMVLDQRKRFIDSDRFYKSLMGYIATERKLALGERKGAIGGKRYEACVKYGYSPKNMVQLFRLGNAGIEFFNTGNFPTNIKDFNADLWKWLISIKTEPERYSPDELVSESYQLDLMLTKTYEATKIKYTFDAEYANEVCVQLYGPVVVEYLRAQASRL